LLGRWAIGLAAVLILSACVDERATRIAEFVPRPFLDRQASTLSHAIVVGNVSGGGFVLATNISDSTFANAMTMTLQRNQLLAATGKEHWRLDCTLDLDQSGSMLGSHSATVGIRYVLHELPGNTVAFDTTIETGQSRQGTGTAYTFALADARYQGTQDGAIRDNLNRFLIELKAWDAAR
jgi:hypothetical protein